jgi:hypothetical protein
VKRKNGGGFFLIRLKMTTAMIKVNGEVAEGAQLALRYLTR